MSHFQWLADRIPGATVVLQPSAAHFAALPVLPEVLAWLREHSGYSAPDAVRTGAAPSRS
jgi:hypothetical protein